MSGEFDEMVRDSMTWFTDGVDVPDGIAARARRHLRRRHRTRMGWFATGTAVAAAAAVLAATAGGGSVPHHQEAKGGATKGFAAKGGRHSVTVQTTAMVIGRVDRALTSAAATDPVAYTRETTEGVRLFLAIPHRRPTEVNASVMETWSRGPLQHVEVVTRTGRLALSMETDLRSGKSVQTTVSYPQRVWWRGTYQPLGRTNPGLACTLGDIDRTPAQWTREVRKLLSCGAAVAGYEKVDGVNAIKLKLNSSYKRACAGANDQRQCQPQPVGWSGVMWADASTYLPVRLVSHGQHYSFRIDFRWLAPTAPNLAKLHQPIPAGFRHV
jgi:hypothetical protein